MRRRERRLPFAAWGFRQSGLAENDRRTATDAMNSGQNLINNRSLFRAVKLKICEVAIGLW